MGTRMSSTYFDSSNQGSEHIHTQKSFIDDIFITLWTRNSWEFAEECERIRDKISQIKVTHEISAKK